MPEDANSFLIFHGCPNTARHSSSVASLAGEITARFGGNVCAGEQAGWLHDISAVIPPDERLETARQFGLEILPEEAEFPLLLHQKLSAVLARELFGVASKEILEAIGCHTTLKADASDLSKALFVADKLCWDQSGIPPYYLEMATALIDSLDRAAACYLDYVWKTRGQTTGVLHPWLLEARRQISRPALAEEKDANP
jgi:HD superfamily phosphohydrolase YqeK